MGNTPTLTPNIGLIIPAVNQPNYNVPLTYDLNLLDSLLGAGGLVNVISQAFVSETLTQVNANTYTSSKNPLLVLAVFYNTAFVDPSQYGLNGNTFTLNFATQAGDKVYAVYFKSA